MYSQGKLNSLSDFNRSYNERGSAITYFYRFDTVNAEVNQFLAKYYEKSEQDNALLNHMKPPTDTAKLAKIGEDFTLDKNVILKKLKTFVTSVTPNVYTNLALAIYDKLILYQQMGKSEKAVQNMFVTWVEWLNSLKFLSDMGNKITKVLFNDSPTIQELWFLSVLAYSGCDVVVILKNGESDYLGIDTKSEMSTLYQCTGTKIDRNFTISKTLPKPVNSNPQTTPISQPTVKATTMPAPKLNLNPKYTMCTNAWLSSNSISAIEQTNRGTDPNLLYNVFIQYNGIWDRASYSNDLFSLYEKLKSTRKVLLIENEIGRPTPNETNIRRESCSTVDQLIRVLATNITYAFSRDLQDIMVKAFADTIIEESKTDSNINHLNNLAITMICWLNRYKENLFSSWHNTDCGLVFLMNGCKNKNESIFMKMLSKMPIDVIILNPSKNAVETPNDSTLLVVDELDTAVVDKFPTDISNLRMSTVAHSAERELDTLLYQDSGIYRDRQFSKANSLILDTMYEEIAILWDQEPKFRQGYNTVNDRLILPILFAKVSGVKDNDVKKYWTSIQSLVTPETAVVTAESAIVNPEDNDVNSMYSRRELARLFLLKSGVNREKIKSHSSFKYDYIREDVLEFMFDKLDELLNNKLIKGTFDTGVEYDIVATILNLPKELVRIIQGFDLTKKNPKIIYISTTEKSISLETSIIMSYLSLIGFDILFFVPTGYQTVEKYFNQPIKEHQIGPFVYDLEIPNKVFTGNSSNDKPKKSSGFRRWFGNKN